MLELVPWRDVRQGVRRVIDVEDWAEIRRLYRAGGLGVKTIAPRLGVARTTVRSALRSETPPKYERASQGSITDGVEQEIPGVAVRVPRTWAFTPQRNPP